MTIHISGKQSKEFILANCNNYLVELKATADVVGPLAMTSIAFLVAVLALFIDLSHDKIVIERSFHLHLEWAIRILCVEVIMWVTIDGLNGTPFGFIPCVTWAVVSIRMAMLAGVGGVAILLVSVVHKVGAILRTRYRS